MAAPEPTLDQDHPTVTPLGTAGTGALEVPVARLGRSARDGAARARAVALIATVSIAGAVALALPDGSAPARPDRARADRPAASAPSATRPTPAVVSQADRPAEDAGRPEFLPDLSSVPLPDAPVALFHRRAGTTLERLAWTAGGPALVPIGTVADGYLGIDSDDASVAVASPDESLFAVRSFGSSAVGGGDALRVFTPDGRTVWTRDDGSGWSVVPTWSPDGRTLLLPAGAAAWRFLHVESGLVVAEVVIPSDDLLGIAAGRPLVPLGFSRDGSSVYLTAAARRRENDQRLARVSTADGTVTPIEAVPLGGPKGLVTDGLTGHPVDPRSGRQYLAPGMLLSVGPTDLRVREADGRHAMTVRFDAVTGSGWAGDGRLLVLETDRYPEPSWVRLVAVDARGRIGQPMLESGPVSGASLAGIRDGHALVVLATSGPAAAAEAIMVDLTEGATATVRLDAAEARLLQFAGWRR